MFYTWYQICIALSLHLASLGQTAPATIILNSATSNLIIYFFIGTEKLLRLTKPGGEEKPCSFYELLSASSWTWEYTSTGTTIVRIPVVSSTITLFVIIDSLIQRYQIQSVKGTRKPLSLESRALKKLGLEEWRYTDERCILGSALLANGDVIFVGYIHPAIEKLRLTKDGQKRIKKCIEELGSNYDINNFMDDKVESITWFELQTSNSTPTNESGVERESLRYNSLLADGSTLWSSGSEKSYIDRDVFEEKRQAEEMEMESNKMGRYLYHPLEVGLTW